MPKRYWEIDSGRGLAVIGMVAFNWMFALTYLGKAYFEVGSGPLWLLARAVAFAFVFLAGLSLRISYNRSKRLLQPSELNKKYAIRGLGIFLLGMLLTLATWLFYPNATIWFGVLHLIGFSIILSIPFLKIKGKSFLALVAFAVVLAGLILANYGFYFPHLLPFGFWPSGWYSFDYFPLMPWYGFFLFGIIAGNMHFPGRKPSNYAGPFSPAVIALSFLGRHSLTIYLLHQPVLLLALALMG